MKSFKLFPKLEALDLSHTNVANPVNSNESKQAWQSIKEMSNLNALGVSSVFQNHDQLMDAFHSMQNIQFLSIEQPQKEDRAVLEQLLSLAKLTCIGVNRNNAQQLQKYNFMVAAANDFDESMFAYQFRFGPNLKIQLIQLK